MNRFVLKNKEGRYVSLNKAGEEKVYHTTPDFDKATVFNAERATVLCHRYPYLTAVNYNTEVLVYYPYCACHVSDEIEAKQAVRKICLGEADGQFSRAIPVYMQGLWFVYARRDGVTA